MMTGYFTIFLLILWSNACSEKEGNKRRSSMIKIGKKKRVGSFCEIIQIKKEKKIFFFLGSNKFLVLSLYKEIL